MWVILPGLDLPPSFRESIRFYLVRCARIYDIPFTLGCMTFVCRRFALQFDRTEHLARELDERVVERTRALTEESEARKSMMLNIFHDLRSPLFAVSSGLDTLEAAPDALPALLPAMQQRMTFLRRLTEDLFLAAKLEQKQVLLNEDRVSLSDAAAAVCESCQNEAAKKGVTLTTRFDARAARVGRRCAAAADLPEPCDQRHPLHPPLAARSWSQLRCGGPRPRPCAGHRLRHRAGRPERRL